MILYINVVNTNLLRTKRTRQETFVACFRMVNKGTCQNSSSHLQLCFICRKISEMNLQLFAQPQCKFSGVDKVRNFLPKGQALGHPIIR